MSKKLHEYAFDVKMFAAIRINAETEAEARLKLADALEAATCTTLIDGKVTEFEASVDEGESVWLFEIDGESTD